MLLLVPSYCSCSTSCPAPAPSPCCSCICYCFLLLALMTLMLPIMTMAMCTRYMHICECLYGTEHGQQYGQGHRVSVSVNVSVSIWFWCHSIQLHCNGTDNGRSGAAARYCYDGPDQLSANQSNLFYRWECLLYSACELEGNIRKLKGIYCNFVDFMCSYWNIFKEYQNIRKP